MDGIVNWIIERIDFVVGAGAIGAGAAYASTQLKAEPTAEAEKPSLIINSIGALVSAVATAAAVILTDYMSAQGLGLGLFLFFGSRAWSAWCDREKPNKGGATASSADKPSGPTAGPAADTGATAKTQEPVTGNESATTETETVVIQAESTVSSVEADGSLSNTRKVGGAGKR